MRLNSLAELYYQLRDMYWAEKEIVKDLPKMTEYASYPELQQAFNLHLEQTRHQVERLEECFRVIGREPDSKKCKGMEGILDEGSEYLKKDADPATRDAALITSAQRVEHYEIAAYGTLRAYAEMLGHHRAAELHQQTLEEEKETDRKLNELAMSIINVDAVRAAGWRELTE